MNNGLSFGNKCFKIANNQGVTAFITLKYLSLQRKCVERFPLDEYFFFLPIVIKNNSQ